MDSASENATRASIHRLALLLGILLVPVCATLAQGGADWHPTEAVQLSWWGTPLAWPMALAALGLVLFEPAPRRRCERLALLGTLSLGLAVAILWTGGTRLGPVSLKHPEPSAWLGLALLAAAMLWPPARLRVGRRPALSLVGALVVGAGLQAALVSLDAAGMARRLSGPEPGPTAAPAPAERPDVLWIVADTLRADAVGAYASLPAVRARMDPADPTPRTPVIDALAERGLLFERVLSSAPWTLPSMMSLFTARWPSTLDPEGRGRVRSVGELIGLDPAVPTWVGVFREAGYDTVGFQKNPFLAPGSGFDAPFDLYRFVGGDRAERDSAAQLVDATLRWADVQAGLRRSGARSPFLAYVHFMDPHIDYRPPRRWLSEAARGATGGLDGSARSLHRALADEVPIDRADRDRLRALYADEVAYLDHEIGRLMEGLRERDLLGEHTLVVLSADHGEQFAEHGGWEHGSLHVENVHVPLILAGAGLPAGRVATPISALDLGPTLIEAIGLPRLEGAEGLVQLADRAAEGPVVSEYGRRTRVEQSGWSLIAGLEGSDRLYDLGSDPGERVDLAARRPERVRALREALRAHRERDPEAPGPLRPDAPQLDGEMLEALRALGYSE